MGKEEEEGEEEMEEEKEQEKKDEYVGLRRRSGDLKITATTTNRNMQLNRNIKQRITSNSQCSRPMTPIQPTSLPKKSHGHDARHRRLSPSLP